MLVLATSNFASGCAGDDTDTDTDVDTNTNDDRSPLAVMTAFVGNELTSTTTSPSLGAELTVAGEPDCQEHPDAEYGFFVDIDPEASPLTGAVGGAVEGLGADLRISARCEGGELVSPAGEVSVEKATDEEDSWLITIAVTEQGLPPTFDWVAYARVDGKVSRAPEAPRVGRKLSPEEVL